MRFNGQLVEWSDARGFGFIQPDRGGDRLFLHISALLCNHALRRSNVRVWAWH